MEGLCPLRPASNHVEVGDAGVTKAEAVSIAVSLAVYFFLMCQISSSISNGGGLGKTYS